MSRLHKGIEQSWQPKQRIESKHETLDMEVNKAKRIPHQLKHLN